MGHEKRYWEMRNAERILVEKSQGKEPHKWPVPRGENNIKIDLSDMSC
jgi:hypothetical protein